MRDVATGEDLPDVVRWGKFGVASWGPGSSGFYYLTFPQPENEDEIHTSQALDRKTMWHALGTEQSEDKLVFELAERFDMSCTTWHVLRHITHA